jgi:DtxR family Mn-dependent transcriptional regulator
MQIRILDSNGGMVRFELDGEMCVLAPLLASNVSVVRLRAEEQEQTSFDKLSSLSPGEEARVKAISRACRGRQRRRLMDLGIVPGTKVRAELKSLTGDPVAYRIRGTTVALRRQQSDLIYVQKEGA